MAGDLRQPLLSYSEGQGRRGLSDAQEHSNTRDTSLRKLGAVEDGNEVVVTGSEIRAAAFTCSPDFCIHDLGILAPEKRELDARLENEDDNLLKEVLRRVQALNEEEIRELLLDHMGLDCCLGQKPAANWKIQRVEDCNAYVGTLETFIEERTTEEKVEPYVGGRVDGLHKGRMPDTWEMDMKAEIPLLFVSGKEVRRKVPNSEVVKICGDCLGCGKLAYTPSKTLRFMNFGKDSSGTSCKGDEGSQNRIRCGWCHGQGALLHQKVLSVKWRTILLKRVCATKSAKSVPDEVFQRAKGVRLYQSQSYQCEPAGLLTSESLNKLSEAIISERAFIPESARIICERHQLSLIPVTRVVMVNKRKSFKFYILGLSREIYVEEYPSSIFSLCGMCNIC